MISKESAIAQLDVLYDYYEIDLSEMSGDVKSAIEHSAGKVAKAIQKGRVEISLDDDGIVKITQTVKGGDTLVYAEMNGQAKIAMGSKAPDDSYGKAYAMMGALCGLGEGAILKLKGKDLSTAEALGVLLLQA